MDIFSGEPDNLPVSIRKKVYSISIVLYATLLTTLHGQAQGQNADTLTRRLELLSDGIHPTSVYLRSSKDVYETMEDLWFKAYSVDLQQQALTDIDRTLYVQLIQASNDSIVWEEPYPLENGIASGNVYLDNSLAEGVYWLCGYTAHSLRGQHENFTDARRIEIVHNVEALLKEDTTPSSSEKKKNGSIHFNMFPEGGQLLSNSLNKVAFKATSDDGTPCAISGKLLENGNEILSFTSVHDGMGSFTFRPDIMKTYSVQLASPHEDQTFKLPDIQEQGLIMSVVDNRKDSLIVQVRHNGPDEKEPFYLRLQNRGMPMLVAIGAVKDSVTVSLPLADVSSGISEITLFNADFIPIGERLVYIRGHSDIAITAELSRPIVGTKEKITLRITARDQNNEPVRVQLGVVAYDNIYRRHTDAKDIRTHYLLSKHLKGNIHNPKYYFDDANHDRHEALDLLLLTQGWRSYLWNEYDLEKTINNTGEWVSDSINGRLYAKKKNARLPKAVIVFTAEQKDKRFVLVDDEGRFSIAPDEMDIGNTLYVTHPGDPEHFFAEIEDPLKRIAEMKPWENLAYPKNTIPMIKTNETGDEIDTAFVQRAIKIDEVVVSRRKESVFRDKYIAQLDSVAKYTNNMDRAHGGWLNCPACYSGEMPIEGKTYIIWTGPNPPTSHPFSFDHTNTKRIVYRYPKYTEEELLAMFGIARSKGYYPTKVFYSPVYDAEKGTSPDFRNTVLWKPDITTDENGNASLEFYSSDINTGFYGIVEGISENGAFGFSEFNFHVKK